MIDPSVRFPGQVDVNANYPQGEARDAAVLEDPSATPLRKDWVSDLWGYQQALAAAMGTVPDNQVDSAVASQQLSLMRAMFASVAIYSIENATKASTARFALTASLVDDGFELDSGTDLFVPSKGRYAVALTGEISTSATVGNFMALQATLNGVAVATGRNRANSAGAMPILGFGIANIEDTGADQIEVVSAPIASQTITTSNCKLFVFKVGPSPIV